MKIKLFIFTAALMMGLAGRHQALAATNPPTGITVSPAFQMVSIAPGASSQPVSFTITNNESAAQTLNLSVQDFSTLNESGGLFFVGTNPTALQKKYGLAKWFSLPEKQVILKPKQTVTLRSAILNLPDLQAGGHYGALMISIGGQNVNSQKAQVGIRPIASSLLFVTKPEGATHTLDLSNVSYKKSLVKLPSAVTLRFRNTGNTHLVPRGIVTVTKAGSGGTVYSKGIVNTNSQIILPQTYRRYPVQLTKLSDARLPGKYVLNVDFRFDGINQFRGFKQSFIYVTPIWLAAFAIAVVGTSLLVIKTTRLKK